MTELKTLKDLINMDVESNYAGCVESDDLTREAIKWIKAFKKGERHTDFAADGRNGQENVGEWIQHFFNITDKEVEEDGRK